MRRLRKLLVGPLVIVTALSSNAFAQQRHVVDPAELAAAINQHVEAQDADRAAIREALGRAEVRRVAEKAGINLDRLMVGIDTMSPADLQLAADAARNVNDTFVGGATTLVISTTTIIIILLILLLIVVAVD